MWFIEEWYLSLPRVTRAYLTAIVATTLALYLDLVSLLLLYLNFGLVYDRFEIWRLVTNFLFFGHFGLGFFFHLTFLYVTSSSSLRLQSSSYFKQGDFVWLYLFCAGGLLVIDWLCWLDGLALTPMFLGPSLAMSIVYVWSRRNPNMRMNLLGFLNFNAPWLPWVIIGLESAIGQSINWFDIVGVAVGHVYYFLTDVYPTYTQRHLIKTPSFVKAVFDAPAPVLAAEG